MPNPLRPWNTQFADQQLAARNERETRRQQADGDRLNAISKLRASGVVDPREIALAIGCPVAVAKRALQRLDAHAARYALRTGLDVVEMERGYSLRNIQTLLAHATLKAQQESRDAHWWAQRVISLEERKAKLLGLDADTGKSGPTVQINQQTNVIEASDIQRKLSQFDGLFASIASGPDRRVIEAQGTILPGLVASDNTGEQMDTARTQVGADIATSEVPAN